VGAQPNPPQISSFVPGRTFLTFKRNPLEFLENSARQGEVVRYRLLGPQFYLLTSPEYVKDVLFNKNSYFIKGRVLQKSKVFMGEGLLTSEEPLHNRQRRLAQRAFHKQRLATYAKTMADLAQEFVGNWKHGEPRDLHTDMMQLTVRIVSKVLFGVTMESEAREIGDHFTELIASALFFYLVPYPQHVLKLPIPRLRRIRASQRHLDSLIYQFIEERRKSREDNGDLLSMLIAAHSEETLGREEDNTQLRDECMSLFTAGHETTANALAWTFLLLAQHPEIEEKLAKEVWEVLQDRKPSFDDVPSLRYAKMVLAESMRLYPPAWIISRQAIKDYQAGPYLIPAGSFVTLSPWVMHHKAEYFPDPMRFDPDRWKDDTNASKMAFRYFPFGAGPRNCIGEGFAWIEAVLILASVMQRWKFELIPGFPVQPDAAMTLRPKPGVKAMVLRRVFCPLAATVNGD
jgi:cytochrome P450